MPSPSPSPAALLCARLPEQWREAMQARGVPAFHGGQVFRWIHQRGVMQPDRMTDLPKALRAALAAEGLGAPAAIVREHRSADGSAKLVLRLDDDACIETVLLPVDRGGDSDDADAAAAVLDDDDQVAAGTRVTQCISTQVGCAMGCVFCASGAAGLGRQLAAGEIVAQVLIGRAALGAGDRLGDVVMMGMGEPLHNYEATALAIRLLTHPEGLALSPRRITVSTVGLPKQIDRLGRDFGGKVGLAVSLHQADDEARSALVPANRRHGLAELMAALGRYGRLVRRRITIEYTLIAGHNDRDEDARRLARLVAPLPVKVNLIPMNPVPHAALGPPPRARVLAFQRLLTAADLACFVRRRRGDDVAAACGQLARARPEP